MDAEDRPRARTVPRWRRRARARPPRSARQATRDDSRRPCRSCSTCTPSLKQAFSRRRAERGADQDPPRALFRSGRAVPRHPAALQRAAAAQTLLRSCSSEIPVSQGSLRPGHLLVRENAGEPDRLSSRSRRTSKFLPDLATIWAPAALQVALAKAGIAFMDPTQVLSYHLAFVLKKYAADFIGIQETRSCSTTMEARFPRAGEGSAARAAAAEDRRDPAAAGLGGGLDPQPAHGAGGARSSGARRRRTRCCSPSTSASALKRYISYKHSSGQNILPAYLLSPDRGHGAQRHPPDLGRQLPGARPGGQQASCGDEAVVGDTSWHRRSRCCSPRWTSAATSAS